MNKALISSLFFIALTTLLTSCSSSKEEEPVNCTDEFVSIIVKLVDKDNAPFSLSSYKVFVGDEDITSKVNCGYGIVGYYPIAHDSMQPQLEGKESIFTFIGYLSDKEILRKNITIGAGQCHIYCKENLTFTIE